MKLSQLLSLSLSLGLVDYAVAAKGKASVKACVWLATEPADSYTVDWKPGSASDKCMKGSGKAGSMRVERQGLTCKDLGVVEVNDDRGCYWLQSKYSISYSSKEVAVSGSTSSRWITGPWHTEIQLKEPSPGTKICGSEALCNSENLEWDNDNDNAVYYIFRPGTVALFNQAELK